MGKRNYLEENCISGQHEHAIVLCTHMKYIPVDVTFRNVIDVVNVKF